MEAYRTLCPHYVPRLLVRGKREHALNYSVLLFSQFPSSSPVPLLWQGLPLSNLSRREGDHSRDRSLQSIGGRLSPLRGAATGECVAAYDRTGKKAIKTR